MSESGFNNLVGSGVDAVGYFVGQCTDGVAMLLSWIPSGLGNAYQWYSNAQSKGLPTTTNVNNVVPGSVVVFNQSFPGSGGEGHVAVVNSYNQSTNSINVTEMNATAGVGKYDTQNYNLSAVGQYIEGYILPPSGTTPYNPGGSNNAGNSLGSSIWSALGTALEPDKQVLFYILIGIGVFMLVMVLVAAGGIGIVKS